MQDVTWFIVIFNIAIAVSVILAGLFAIRWKYQRDVLPSRKHPQGRMVAEFWTELGPRYRDLCEIQTNGWEIKAPSGHDCPRYFFDKPSMGMTKYPLQPVIPFRFVQIDVPIVSWYENDPEPINPKRVDADGNPVSLMTSEMHDLVRDTDSLGAGQTILREDDERQSALVKALANMPNKRYIYAMLILAAGSALGAAVFAYQAFQAVTGG